METTRRDFVKLTVTTAVIATSGFAARELLQSSQQPKEVNEIRPVGCLACGAQCGLLFVRRGDSMYLLPNLKHPQAGQCFRPSSALQLWDHPLRLKKPLKRVGKRGEGKFQEVDWDTALNEIAAKLRDIVQKYGPESVAFTTHDHLRWHLPLVAAIIGTPNVVGHEATCHTISTAARRFVLGAGGPPSVDPDYENVTYLMLIGRNMDAAMGKVRRLMKARERGAKIVVVDPRAPNIAYSNVEWVPINPGTDAAFVLSMIYVLISENLYDATFVKKWTNGPFLIKPDGTPLTEKDLGREGAAYLVYDNATKQLVPHDKAQDPSLDFEGEVETPGGPVRVKTAFRLLTERVAKYRPEDVAKITDVSADTIVRLARELAISRGVVEDGWYAAKNGNDFDLYMAILILNALLGNIDKKGGLCFQESTGFPPAITSTADRIVTITGHKLPPIKATRVDRAVYPEAVSQFDAVLDAVIEEKPYPVKALFIVATSPIHRDINHEKLFKALEKLELVVTIDILPQDHVDWSDYVLPDLMFLERKHVEGIKWTLHPGIWLNSKILDPPPGVDARDSFWALMEIVRRAFPERAALVDYTEKYADPHTFEEYEAGIIEAVLTSLAKRWGVKLEDLKTALERDGFYVFKQKTYEVRPYKTPLGTPSGKVEIYALRALRYKLDPLPDFRPPWYKLPKAPDEFYLVNGKDNTISAHVVFTKNAKYIVEREVWMSPVDAARLGIKDGNLVELEGLDNGYKAAARVKVTNRVKPGVLYTHAFAGGRKSVFITGEYSFLKDGVNPSSFASHKPTPVIGAVGTNASVRVRKL